jgi:conjugal transfer pilus assembly protein TraB
MADISIDAAPEAKKATWIRSPETVPATTLANPPEAPDVMLLNAKIRKKQQMILGGIAGGVLLAGSAYVFSGTSDDDKDAHAKPETIETGGLVNRDLAQREFVSMYENRLQDVLRQQQALGAQVSATGDVAKQLDALKSENQQMRANGQAAIDAISAENEALRREITTAKRQPASPLPPGYPANAAATTGPGALGGAAGDPTGIDRPAEIRTMSFSSDKGASPSGPKVQRADTPALIVEDSPDYLPPNSYAPARVIVGVDASAGVASQTDPLPVVLRITGPARSVMKNGKVLTTRIEGCIVNGAARGDLSAEKVYVKLARMTCDQPGGRVAVSEVKGFISFGGKTGVRGRVVSREGNLATQALLAGVIGGFGRGLSANANSTLSGTNVSVGGKRQKLSAGDVLAGGLGEGAAEAADTVSKYLIERAEQYQPVVEMPTGIAVEIVFLDGVHVRSSK